VEQVGARGSWWRNDHFSAHLFNHVPAAARAIRSTVTGLDLVGIVAVAPSGK
jgi:hypothetical protein